MQFEWRRRASKGCLFMRFLRDLSVRGKLLGGFGAVLALTAILGIVLLA